MYKSLVFGDEFLAHFTFIRRGANTFGNSVYQVPKMNNKITIKLVLLNCVFNLFIIRKL